MKGYAKVKNVKCIECKHCYSKDLKCRPESEDCKKEYDLTEEDLKTTTDCDFYEKK